MSLMAGDGTRWGRRLESRSMTRRTEVAVRARIEEGRPDDVWSAWDFGDLGSTRNVEAALDGFAAEGWFRGFGHGLHYRPRWNALTRRVTVPSSRRAVDAVTRRAGTRHMPDGMTSANDMGLTTAVPARLALDVGVDIPDLELGAMVITFRRVPPDRMSWAGRPAMRLVQALHWLDDVIPADGGRVLARVDSILADPTHGGRIREDLARGRDTLPDWMRGYLGHRLDSPLPEPDDGIPSPA